MMKAERKMRYKIYHFLVNRYPEIRERYHRKHDNAAGIEIPFSWLYLLLLNIRIRLPGNSLRERKEDGFLEEKHLPIEAGESELAAADMMRPEELAAFLAQYDIISFDVFDTLLFRPFSAPTDVFYFVGEELSFLNFKELRVRFEREAREEKQSRCGQGEVTLKEIWEKLSDETGIRAERGMQAELDCEETFCYANPYMLEVYRLLRRQGKRFIAVSDMYLPSAFIKKLLEKAGYDGIGQVFVSCEYGEGKSDGTLFDQVRECLPEKLSVVHIGDNLHSDVKMAKKKGFAVYYYPNTDQKANVYRAQKLSPVIGGAYRGIVNHHLYNGLSRYDLAYEYGYIYGGLFVMGYCNFIHEYCRSHEIGRILFLSRDGDIIKQAYDFLYPGEETAYVYWSRAAATKLMAEDNRYDYFRRFLSHKVNQGKTLKEVFRAMDLEPLLGSLPDGLSASDYLDEGNARKVRRFLLEKWETVLAVYEEQEDAAREYYAQVLRGCKRACAVDIGWAGSGAVSLAWLVEHKWKLSCRITGMIAGTNTPHNEEAEASETFLQSGRLVSYMYSSAHNRDLWKLHDPNRDYNIYWELLLASPTRQFLRFKRDGQGKVELCFGAPDDNQEGICQIQKGILDFIRDYQMHFKEYPQMYSISGRDAYAPMLAAAGEHERYLKKIKELFDFKAGVGE